MLGAIFIGFPISFTLLFLALTFGYFGLGHVVFDLAYFQTIGMMKEELLAAVPLFIFMGFLTEQAGLMERLFHAFRMILAPIARRVVRGGDPDRDCLRHGDRHRRCGGHRARHHGGADHEQDGYDPKLAAGCITAGGTLGILIPPSVMLIVMGPVIGVGGRALLGCVRSGVPARRHLPRVPHHPLQPQSEARPAGAEGASGQLPLQLVTELLIGVVPLLVLIGAVLGSMLGGLATPTEASAIGAAGAALLTLAYRKFTWA